MPNYVRGAAETETGSHARQAHEKHDGDSDETTDSNVLRHGVSARRAGLLIVALISRGLVRRNLWIRGLVSRRRWRMNGRVFAYRRSRPQSRPAIRAEFCALIVSSPTVLTVHLAQSIQLVHWRKAQIIHLAEVRNQ